MTATKYLEERGWKPTVYGLVVWNKEGIDEVDLSTEAALWIEWQDLAKSFVECIVAFRLNIAFNANNDGAVDALMTAALTKHNIEIKTV